MAQVLVFGDSIGCGAWDAQGGWVDRLRKEFHKLRQIEEEDDYFLVYNLSVSGDSSEEVLERFENESKARISPESRSIIILAVGTNDASYDNKKKKNMIPLKEFEKNIHKIIGKARHLTNEIFFLDSTPADESKSDPMPWTDGEFSEKNEFIEQYRNKLKAICQEEKIQFIELYPDWIDINYEILLDDGVHPNTEGHKLIFEAVKDNLKNAGILRDN